MTDDAEARRLAEMQGIGDEVYLDEDQLRAETLADFGIVIGRNDPTR